MWVGCGCRCGSRCGCSFGFMCGGVDVGVGLWVCGCGYVWGCASACIVGCVCLQMCASAHGMCYDMPLSNNFPINFHKFIFVLICMLLYINFYKFIFAFICMLLCIDFEQEGACCAVGLEIGMCRVGQDHAITVYMVFLAGKSTNIRSCTV